MVDIQCTAAEITRGKKDEEDNIIIIIIQYLYSALSPVKDTEALVALG